MPVVIHAAAGAVALLCVSVFWCATAISELVGDHATIAFVKASILCGMVVLIPALALAGASGLALGRGWKFDLVRRKALRMRFAAANGLLILVPSAIYLAVKSGQGAFDAAFYGVQAVELLAGAANFVLLGLNMRDGLALRRRRKGKSALLAAG